MSSRTIQNLESAGKAGALEHIGTVVDQVMAEIEAMHRQQQKAKQRPPVHLPRRRPAKAAR